MSHRGTKAAREYLWGVEQRRMGRDDARAGRRATFSDQYYQRGYREGKAPCACSNSTAHPDGCQRNPGAVKLCKFCREGHNE